VIILSFYRVYYLASWGEADILWSITKLPRCLATLLNESYKKGMSRENTSMQARGRNLFGIQPRHWASQAIYNRLGASGVAGLFL
jgi:hypothetical protein